ncbi:MAG: hypothetical protein J5657_06050 [Clostridiales bacterium]|nr:hypothetical protein [Clostridiales bacterium]
MTASTVIALAFNAVALAALLFSIFLKLQGDLQKYRNYLIASSAVYLSGTVLITVIIVIAEKIPITFTLISEIMILFIFLVVMFVLVKSIKTLQELKEQAQAGKMRSAEQVKAEDEAFYGPAEKEDREEEDEEEH